MVWPEPGLRLHWVGRSWLGVVARMKVRTFRQSSADGV